MTSLNNYINENILNESLLATAVATSMVMSRSSHSHSSSYDYKDDSSTLAKWLSRGLRVIFLTGTVLLVQLPALTAGIAGLVCLLLAISFNYSELIDKHILKESEEDIEINEGLKEKIKTGLIKLALKNKTLHKYFEDITKLDEFKKSKEDDSLKDMIKCVVNYFKDNVEDNECKKLKNELS